MPNIPKKFLNGETTIHNIGKVATTLYKIFNKT
jgi:hypothetical protein